MIGPLDVQVLVNRTLEVQKLQGNAMHLPEDENENFKQRLDNQVKKEEQQVRRKSEIVHGQIREDGRRKEEMDKKNEEKRNSKDEMKKKKTKSTNGLKGRFIDMEL
jgi:hypothetical protein